MDQASSLLVEAYRHTRLLPLCKPRPGLAVLRSGAEKTKLLLENHK
jgi:hypothetical protein